MIRFISFTCLALVLGTLAFTPALLADLKPSLVDRAYNADLEPCYANQNDALIPISYSRWVDLMVKERGDAFEHPVDRIIPTGDHKGQWILPGCFAVEGRDGTLTVWRIPFNTEVDPPFFVPHTS